MIVEVDIGSEGREHKVVQSQQGSIQYTVLSTVLFASVHCQPSRRTHQQHLRRVRLSRFVAAALGVLSLRFTN